MRDLRILRLMVIDEVVHVGGLVGVDPAHRLAHRAIEGRVGFGVDPVGGDLGAVMEGRADDSRQPFFSANVM